MKFDSLSELIKNRRSIQPNMYSDQDIDNNLIDSILENARWAPTHKKTQPWRFKIFKGAALQSLSQYMGDYYKQNTAAENKLK